MGPFDRFDSSAKRVLALAQDEAIRFNHNYIGTEHLILGLMREGQGVAAQVLNTMGADLSKMRTAVSFIIGRGDAATSPSEITLSPRTKKVIEFAADEARLLGQADVRTEHLLLGLVREGEGIAAGVLESLGISLQSLRVKVIEALQGPARPGQPEAVVVHPGSAQPTWISSRRNMESRTPLDLLAEATQRVIALAQNEAIGLGQTWLGTEHLVLGLIIANGTLTQKVAQSLGITADAVRERVAKIPAPGAEWRAHELQMTLLAERLIQRAPPGWPPMTPQGLLFAIVGEDESQGAKILAGLGATAQKVRDELVKLDPPH
jgi:ATP-dependent Clp protease ATP-binding subunit ClpA